VSYHEPFSFCCYIFLRGRYGMAEWLLVLCIMSRVFAGWLLLCVSVSYICPTSDRKVKVEHLISKRTHKPIALRFWVRVWSLSSLCGCSSLEVDAPPGSPHDSIVVSEPWFDEGYDRGSWSVAEKPATAVQCRSVAEKPATTIQASKSFCLKGEHDEYMDSQLRGSVVCKCELYMSHIG